MSLQVLFQFRYGRVASWETNFQGLHVKYLECITTDSSLRQIPTDEVNLQLIVCLCASR